MFKGIGACASGIIIIVSTVGCGRDLSLYQHRERTVAPQSQAQAGLIVRGALPEDIANVLDRHPAAEFRVLNSDHQMYELLGVSADEIKAELPEVAISRNEYFSTIEPGSKLAFRALAEQAAGEKLQKCVEADSGGPQAVLTVETLQKEVDARTLPRHAVLRVNGTKSLNITKASKPLRMAFIVMRPKGSLEAEEEILQSNTIEVKTDAMGGYGVGLIVQDENNVCDLDVIEFGVTENVPYKGRNPSPPQAPNLKELSHLSAVHAVESWARSQGSGMVIAVIDTGVNYNHPLLRDNILVNAKEIPGNKIDDDNNGFIDDVVGWDFANRDAMPFDDAGHGSHVAGLAASSVMGLAKSAKILPVKVLGAFGGDTGAVAAGIRYAVDRGARILNLSLGSYEGPSAELVAAITYAESKGVLVVAAAGNGHPLTGLGVDTDKMPNFPSSLGNSNILAVAALGAGDALAIYSNYGLKTVDVAAPGGDDERLMTSTYMDNPAGIQLIEMAGTSMASPVVAGIAAQVWSLKPQLKFSDIKKVLMSTGPSVAGLESALVSGRKVDALAAVGGLSLSTLVSAR